MLQTALSLSVALLALIGIEVAKCAMEQVT